MWHVVQVSFTELIHNQVILRDQLIEEAVSRGLGSSLGGCVIVVVMVYFVFFFYIIIYHCKVDHFPWYESPFFFFSSIGWQGGARLVHEVTNRFKPMKNLGWYGCSRVSFSSLGVGAFVQLTTEESWVLERPSNRIWRIIIFQILGNWSFIFNWN